MNFKTPVILASNSPRRQELLSALGVDFVVQAALIKEEYSPDLAPDEVPEYLAKQKAEAVSIAAPKALVIAADTVVILDNSILGKPEDLAEAKDFLKKLSGQTHQVVTGVCLKYQDRLSLFKDTTEVSFGTLTASEINYYVEKFRPMDKAGAYGIQEWIGMVGVTKIEGSYFSVVGLPVQKLYQELKRFQDS